MASASPEREGSTGSRGENPLFEALKKRHAESYRYLSHAVGLEEKGKPAEALRYYDRGLDHLRKGIEIDLGPSDETDEYVKSDILREKMRVNLASYEERVRELRALQPHASASTTSPVQSPAASSDMNPESSGIMSFFSSMLPSSTHNNRTTNTDASSAPASSSSKTLPKPATTRGDAATSATTGRGPVATARSRAAAKGESHTLPTPRSNKAAAARSNSGTLATKKPSTTASSAASTTPTQSKTKEGPSQNAQKRVSKLVGIDKNMANIVLNEVMLEDTGVCWDDIIGLENAKMALRDAVILPAQRPDLFQGLLAPCKGLLLFGPPGNGKTMIAKALAHEAQCTFFSITASSLTSKYVGESEKLVRALFACARELQPAIIFIDEIDSLLTSRSDKDQDSTRRLKTEFLTAFDGVSAAADERILVLGATNLPNELDDAAVRRLPKRIYVPLPDAPTRAHIVRSLLRKTRHSLSAAQVDAVARATDGYSGSDLAQLAKEAAFGPIRELGDRIRDVAMDDVRPVSDKDFFRALSTIRASVKPENLKSLEKWAELYGC